MVLWILKLPKNFDNISYWASWTISLMVTASNGFLQLFSLDKNYFEYAITTATEKIDGSFFNYPANMKIRKPIQTNINLF